MYVVKTFQMKLKTTYLSIYASRLTTKKIVKPDDISSPTLST